MRRVVAASLACVAAGCGLVLDLAPEDRDGGASVTADGALGDDASCDPSDASASGSDGGVDAGARPLACGGPSALRDEFLDGVRSPFWIAQGPDGSTLRETAMTLEVRAAPGIGGATQYASSFAYDARADRVAVRVPTVARVDGLSTFLGVWHGPTMSAAIVHTGGFMGAYVDDEAMPLVSAAVAYDRAAHTWWQVRGDDAAGEIVFEVSGDDLVWAPIFRVPAPRWLESVHVHLGVFAAIEVAEPDVARFEFLNYDPGHPPSVYCPAHAFSDAFEDGVLDDLRWLAAPGCDIVEGDSTIAIGPGAPMQPCAIATRHGYDLRSSHGFFVPESLVTTRSWALGLSDAGGAVITASCMDGTVFLVGPESWATAPCPTKPIWKLDVRGDGSARRVILSVSDDRAVWDDVVRIEPVGFDADTVRIGVGALPESMGVKVASYNAR